jgi:hypothetical protein
MAPKRPIDSRRDSAKSITIHDDDDKSAITDMIPVGDRLLMVKAHSIHAIQLADQIDPNRTNPDVPDTQQRLISLGAEDAIVARTLLTAHTLFKKSVLGPSFDEEKGLKLAFELLRDIDALDKMRAALQIKQAEAEATFKTQERDVSSLRLPSIADIAARFDAFAQKAGHVVNSLEEIAKLFYGARLATKWIDSLGPFFESKFGSGSEEVEHFKNVRSFLLLALGLRNMVEHPLPDRRATVFDYQLSPLGKIDRPTVEIVRPGEGISRATIILLIEHWLEQFVSASEALMVLLCQANARPFSGLSIFVTQLPPEQRSYKQQRFFYACNHGGQVVRFG